MPKKPHRADMAILAKIAEAAYFTVHLRSGPHETVKKEATTLLEAIAIRDQLGTTPSGKRAMIYAVGADKLTAHVSSDVIAQARENDGKIEIATSGPDAAKEARKPLTAIGSKEKLQRATAPRACANGRPMGRRAEIADNAAKGVKTAVETLVAGPFDMAEHILREHVAGKALTIADVHAARDGAAPAKADEIATDPMSVRIGEAADARRAKREAREARKAEKPAGGKRAAALEAAQRGELPDAPDFSAPTHKPHRKRLGEVIALVEAGDIDGLKAFHINPVSSSPKAIAKYRDLAVVALEARQQMETA